MGRGGGEEVEEEEGEGGEERSYGACVRTKSRSLSLLSISLSLLYSVFHLSLLLLLSMESLVVVEKEEEEEEAGKWKQHLSILDVLYGVGPARPAPARRQPYALPPPSTPFKEGLSFLLRDAETEPEANPEDGRTHPEGLESLIHPEDDRWTNVG